MIFKIAFWILSLQTIFKPCPCKTERHSIKPKISFIEKIQLPRCLNESSGLIVLNDTIYSHNDSGGLPFLYRFSKSGQFYDSVKVNNAKNVDWEEITSDMYGNIFVGDFGNNYNERRDLCIYKIDTLKNVRKINFSYSNQTEFPPHKRKLKNFDCEAMLQFQDKLVLFSKAKTSKKEILYLLNPNENSQILIPWFHFKLHERVTSATVISENVIAILSYGKLIVCKLPDIENAEPKIKILYCKKLPLVRQSEAVTYNSGTLYISNEQGDLFRFKVELLPK